MKRAQNEKDEKPSIFGIHYNFLIEETQISKWNYFLIRLKVKLSEDDAMATTDKELTDNQVVYSLTYCTAEFMLPDYPPAFGL